MSNLSKVIFDVDGKPVQIMNMKSEFLGLKIAKAERIKYRPDGLVQGSKFPMNHWEITLERHKPGYSWDTMVRETIFFSTGSALTGVTVFSILESLVLDAYSSSMYEEFCDEFGYELWDPKAQQIFKACQKSAQQLQNLFPDLTLDELNEKIQEENDRALAQHKA